MSFEKKEKFLKNCDEDDLDEQVDNEIKHEIERKARDGLTEFEKLAQQIEGKNNFIVLHGITDSIKIT